MLEIAIPFAVGGLVVVLLQKAINRLAGLFPKVETWLTVLSLILAVVFAAFAVTVSDTGLVGFLVGGVWFVSLTLYFGFQRFSGKIDYLRRAVEADASAGSHLTGAKTLGSLLGVSAGIIALVVAAIVGWEASSAGRISEGRTWLIVIFSGLVFPAGLFAASIARKYPRFGAKLMLLLAAACLFMGRLGLAPAVVFLAASFSCFLAWRRRRPAT